MSKLVEINGAERQRWYCHKNQNGLLVLLVSMGMMLVLLGGYALVAKTKQTLTINQHETYVVGEAFKMGNLQYTINSIRTSDGDTDRIKPPRDGRTFLLVGLTVENQGSSDAEIRSMIGFNLKDQEGRRQDFSMGAFLSVKDAIDGTIPAGGKMTGELGYEVMKGAQTYKLAIIPDPLSLRTAIATVEIPIQ